MVTRAGQQKVCGSRTTFGDCSEDVPRLSATVGFRWNPTIYDSGLQTTLEGHDSHTPVRPGDVVSILDGMNFIHDADWLERVVRGVARARTVRRILAALPIVVFVLDCGRPIPWSSQHREAPLAAAAIAKARRRGVSAHWRTRNRICGTPTQVRRLLCALRRCERRRRMFAR